LQSVAVEGAMERCHHECLVAVTCIQRFGSALNLNVHFHMLFLDGIYIDGFNKEKQLFKRAKAPTAIELNSLVHKLS
jgi:hypothetical protein